MSVLTAKLTNKLSIVGLKHPLMQNNLQRSLAYDLIGALKKIKHNKKQKSCTCMTQSYKPERNPVWLFQWRQHVNQNNNNVKPICAEPVWTGWRWLKPQQEQGLEDAVFQPMGILQVTTETKWSVVSLLTSHKNKSHILLNIFSVQRACVQVYLHLCCVPFQPYFVKQS